MVASITEYKSYFEAGEDMTDAEYGQYMRAVHNFAFNDIEPDYSKLLPLVTERLMKNWGEIKDQKARKGKYSANWKGGVSDENHRIRTSKEYREWRAKVFQRDKFTCQICGQVGGELNAHHIKHFSKDKAKRLSVDNGITLCAECHRLVHKVEGK